MLDTLIKNALIIGADGRSRGSIGIRGEHIAGLYEPGAEPGAHDTIAADRLAVLPGVIDMHSHHREGAEKGWEYKETILTATRQCAAGGITTSVGMPTVVPPPNSVERLLRAEVAHALDDDDRALDELAAIPDADAGAPLARHRAGQIEIARGRARPAEARFLDAIRLLPDGVKPRRELVYIYNIQRRQAELDATLGELLRRETLDFPYVLHWTKTRNTPWNPRGDLPSLERFVAADPGDRWSRLSLAEALRRLDRLDEARRVLAPLPDSDPDARAARVLLAMDRGALD